MHSVKVEVEDVGSVRRKIHVEVPAEVVNDAIEEAYQTLRKTARLKGFRPGKIPRTILERYYGERVRYDVTTKLVQESYAESLKEKDLNPVSQPDFGDLEVRPGEDLRYTATVEVRPEVEVRDYVGLKANEEEVKVSQKQVEGRLEEIRQMFASLENVTEDRPVQEGDVVLAEHQLFIAGESVSDGEPQEEMLEIKKDRMEEELYKALIGMRPGEEVQIPRQFSSDHPDPKVADREGVLELKVKSIREKRLPDLDNELAERLGEYKTLEELQERIREDLEEAERQRIISDINQTLIEQLLERHPMEVPEAMVELQIQQTIRNAQQRLAARGLTMEQAGSDPEDMRRRFRDSADRAVRSMLILEAISRQEGIQAAEEDLNAAYDRIAKQTGRDLQSVKSLYKDADALDSLKASIREEKTLDFLRDKANIVKKKRTVKKKKG